MKNPPRPYKMRRKMPRMASISTLYRKAEEGMESRDWYDHARKHIQSTAVLLDIEPSRLSDLLALFSPRVGVKKSINLALHYIQRGEFRYDTMRGIRASVNYWEEAGIIRGPKTSRFARCLAGDQLSVVLDVWMARAFKIDDRLWSCRGIYAEGARRVAKTADHLGITPAQCQAAIWSAEVLSEQTRYHTLPQLNLRAALDETITLYNDLDDPTEDIYHRELPV